jgi:membrane-associated phospholipid phosphatase
LQVRGAIEHYCVEQSGRLSRPRGPDLSFLPDRPARDPFAQFGWLPRGISRDATGRFRPQVLTLGTFAGEDRPGSTLAATAETQPAAAPTFTPPEGYWRKDLWHQMGYEAKQFGERDFWRGFKTSFWDVENALILTATMGASITIRGTGVDDTIRNRTHGSRAMGDMDETVQILGHPGTHFAATGVLWLTSALTKDMKQHEVAQALTQALAVNGVTTLALKAATNTRAPNGDHFAWPSGHTSSAFAAAAVLNEYYGPLVGIPSLALAGLVGYQRIDSRVHDFSDVVFGAMMGYVIGTSVARDGKAEFPELFGMKVIPYVDPETNASGLALLKQW